MRPLRLHRSRIMLCLKVSFVVLLIIVCSAMPKHGDWYIVPFIEVWMRFECLIAVPQDLPYVRYAVLPQSKLAIAMSSQSFTNSIGISQASQGAYRACFCSLSERPVSPAVGMDTAIVTIMVLTCIRPKAWQCLIITMSFRICAYRHGQGIALASSFCHTGCACGEGRNGRAF